MKPSINKSLQQMWSRLTEGPTYRKIIERSRPIPFEILMKRKEIEGQIVKLLNGKKENNFMDLDYIKQLIYEENGSDTMREIIAIFDSGDVKDLNSIMKVVTDAWNYFPHRLLDGKSPKEMYTEYHNTTP